MYIFWSIKIVFHSVHFSHLDHLRAKLRKTREERDNWKQQANLNAFAKTALKRILNQDQIDVLVHNRQRAKNWSEETIQDGLKLKFATGSSGYAKLGEKFPLPSIRTLTRRLENLKFDVGILLEILERLSLKRQCMDDDDLDCGIVFDEMSIAELRKYCQANQKYYGNVTVGSDRTTKATHALVFMLVGVRRRWKQIVCYEFTGNSIPSMVIKDLINQLITLVEGIGFHVSFIVSDCSSSNKRYWKDSGLQYTKDTVMDSKAPQHPLDSHRSLEIIPDAVHVFKSAVQGWIANETVELPEETAKEHNLPTRTASIWHLRDLVVFEQHNKLKVISKLNVADVDFASKKKSSHFDKMKVFSSTKFVNHNNASALRLFAKVANRPDVLATAFFIECLAKWFSLSTNRSRVLAFSKGMLILRCNNFNIFLTSITIRSS